MKCQLSQQRTVFVCLLGVLLCGSETQAARQGPGPVRDEFWSPSAVSPSQGPLQRHGDQAQSRLQLQRERFEARLLTAPRENHGRGVRHGVTLSLPLPDGQLQRFLISESPVMEAGLALKFPHLRTYVGQSLDDPRQRVRLNLSRQGLHAFIVGGDRQVFIDPATDGSGEHVSYVRDAAAREADGFECLASAEPVSGETAQAAASPGVGGELRVARLALAATGEYTLFHGGTVEGALSAMVTAVNRINAIYESELLLRFVLVASNDAIIFTNVATDPYAGADATAMLLQNQSTVDARIGDANYDIGHVFSTAGGGLAQVGGAFASGWKARGVTGRASPVGDPFYVDYVAHEWGHQLGAHHTFNGISGACASANRHAGTAYEPGSGSTIMSYAGLCEADNLQSASDAYFHAASLWEMQALLAGRGGTGQPIENRVPTVDAGPDRVIPWGTPFVLTATGWDEDGDPLTYCWEQIDLGPAALLSAPDSGRGPLFRSRPAVAEPARRFPNPGQWMEGGAVAGEVLPTTARMLNFTVTARDGASVAMDAMQVTVASAGPFRLTTPNGGEVCSLTCMVGWEVAGTDLTPVSAATVDILLSTNGGLDYPIVLATSTPNDGSETVALPDVYAECSRLMVRASGKVFFTVSGADFMVHPHAGAPEFVVESVSVSTATALLIPAVNTAGNASSYPASLVVEDTGATIEDVAVELHGLTHTWSPDLDVLLVPPVGDPIMLLSDVGSGDGLNGAVLRFSDAGLPVPATGLAGPGGHYLPTNIGQSGDGFPFPEPYPLTFAGLQGRSPAGVWSLYLRDDAKGDIGELAGGWSLHLTVRRPLPMNQPPVVVTEPLRYVHEGAEMVVQPQASDPDGNAQGLSFAVTAADPEGVLLDPGSGTVSWRPPPGSAGMTNEFLITVTDSGLPAQSATTDLMAVVVPPVRMQALGLDAGMLTLTWSAAPGNWYEVQVAEGMGAERWTSLPNPVQAAGFECSLTGLPAQESQQFFRIKVLD